MINNFVEFSHNKSMMKAKNAFVILLFFLCLSGTNFSFVVKSYAYQNTNKTISNYEFEFVLENKNLNFSTKRLLNDIKLTNVQFQTFQKQQNRIGLAHSLMEMGFSKKDALAYALPEIDLILKKLTKKLNIEPQPDTVFVEKNKCKIKTYEGKNGKFLDVQSVYEQILKQKEQTKIKVYLNIIKLEKSKISKTQLGEKSCFSTDFWTSSEARKNNIKTALSIFDGLVLDVGEVFSFNQITGRRDKENGYSQAKIISGGIFVEGYGGGVCQVSTTIYNACLLAGLEVLEVHNHSLPVGYVEPSFDAMVNVGSSDLIVRNNSGDKIVITTSSENDICKVKIFGNKNKYKITRVSEKLKIIPAEKDVVETNLEKFENIKLEVGEERRLSYPKDGLVSKGYLNFYDESGKLIKTEHIRTNSYSPVKGIILKREK